MTNIRMTKNASFMYYSTSTSSSKGCLSNFLRLRLSPVSVFFVPIYFTLLWAFLNLVFLKGSSRMRAAPLISSSAAGLYSNSSPLNWKSSSSEKSFCIDSIRLNLVTL
ncbi:hypothetical protein GQX74_010941 [Glossina fuscipes]|nr:hypothetical protein GQX74_010941 [Glossina fuscipes]